MLSICLCCRVFFILSTKLRTLILIKTQIWWNLHIQHKPVTCRNSTTSASSANFVGSVAAENWVFLGPGQRTEKWWRGIFFHIGLWKGQDLRKQHKLQQNSNHLVPIAWNKIVIKVHIGYIAARVNAEKRSLLLTHWYITTFYIATSLKCWLDALNWKHSASHHASLSTPTIQFTWFSVNISSSKVKEHYWNWNQKWRHTSWPRKSAFTSKCIPVFDMFF